MLRDLVDSNRRFVSSCSLYVQNKEEAVYTASYRGRPLFGLVLRRVKCGMDTFIVHVVGFIVNAIGTYSPCNIDRRRNIRYGGHYFSSGLI